MDTELENIPESKDSEEFDAIAFDEQAEQVEKAEQAESSEGVEERLNLTDEELDNVADTAIAALKDILKYFNVGEVTIDEYEGDEGELILDITGGDLAVLIGRHGRTLDALQFLISAITVRSIGFRFPVIVDIEGYKNRQRQKLEALARSSANKAARSHKSVNLRPMSPYERRIVHVALREDKRVSTASEGEGAGRHVVVIPTR